MKIEIWMEGYIATGESNKAMKIWEGQADSFDDAIIKYEQEENVTVDRYTGDQAKRSKYGIWACRLFDNESQARQSFG